LPQFAGGLAAAGTLNVIDESNGCVTKHYFVTVAK